MWCHTANSFEDKRKRKKNCKNDLCSLLYLTNLGEAKSRKPNPKEKFLRENEHKIEFFILSMQTVQLLISGSSLLSVPDESVHI